MDTMLNEIPYIVVKEYFFKNTASTMIDFVKRIMGVANEAYTKVKEDSPVDNANEKSSSGSSSVK